MHLLALGAFWLAGATSVYQIRGTVLMHLMALILEGC